MANFWFINCIGITDELNAEVRNNLQFSLHRQNRVCNAVLFTVNVAIGIMSSNFRLYQISVNNI